MRKKKRPIGVFLSHNWADKDFVRRLAGDLVAAGARVWIDEAEIKVGDSLIEKIRAGIDSMDYVAAILSPNSIKSKWVRKELDIAMNQEIEGRRVKVLPLLLSECKLPGFLKGKKFADFRKPDHYHLNLTQVLQAIGIAKNMLDTERQFSDDIVQDIGTPQDLSAEIGKLEKKYADDLRKMVAFQKRIIDKIPDPVFVTRNKKTDEGRLIWRIDVANRAAYNLFGYDDKQKALEGVDARSWLKNELSHLREALREKKGEATGFEINIPHEDGHLIPMSISTAVLEKDEFGHITRTICIAKDLSRVKKLETQLEHLNRATLSLLNTKTLEEAYNAIFENLEQIGYGKGMISLIDETSRTIVGRRAIGKNWVELQDKTNIAIASNDILARVVKSGKPELIEDCTKNPYCDQETLQRAGITSQYIIPLIAQDKVIGTLQIDLSERQDLIKGDRYYLNESLTILSSFANHLAIAIESFRQKIRIQKLETTVVEMGHEFKYPLQTLTAQLGGLKYYLQKKYGDDEKVRQIAEIIQEEVFRADRQMRNALLAAPESIEPKGNFEESLISETIAFCAERFRETAQKREIRIIIYDSLKKLPVIYYDKTQIEQVFTNLIDNAIKYSYAKESIEIKGEDHGRRVEISVKDNGVGIPERLYEKIFEGFVRSDKLDPTRFIPGTGLGLKIVKKCVVNHNGKIFVHSKPYVSDPQKVINYEGYATTFFVILPKNPRKP